MFLWEPDDDDGDPDDGIFNYVALGASNTNGYGMSGYISEEDRTKFLNKEVKKEDINVYGYQKVPEGSYPDLIRDHYVDELGEDKVTLDQLSISSMRVEELRILLDDTYDGDDYSAWRFTGAEGWFLSAESGGISALRSTYQEKITDADLITVDIGWNNFGVYVCNQLIEYMNAGTYLWTTELSEIFDAEDMDVAEDAKAIISGYIQQNMGSGPLTSALTDIFAYSILGYIHNFDIVMDRMYALNPDADVVVIGVQNLLHDVVVKIDGSDFPLGDLFGNFVDMANYYVSSCSPHHEDYLYVKAGVGGHVSTFLDQMKDYDGDVANLDRDIKDCYDLYDENLLMQITLGDEFIKQIDDGMLSFVLILSNESTGADFVTKGKAGVLGDDQELFDMIYWSALDAAYDTLSAVVKEVATMGPVNADVLIGGLNIPSEEDRLKNAIMDEILDNVMAAIMKEDYEVNMTELMPDDGARLVTAMYVRFYMGNSFFIHPNEEGHSQIMTAVMDLIDDPDSEKEQALSEGLKGSVIEIQGLISG